MSITKSYNKHTNTYYAYKTSYSWDVASLKMVQKKRCIGKFDPVTGEVIPNSRKGRPPKASSGRPDTCAGTVPQPDLEPEIKSLATKVNSLEAAIGELSRDLHEVSSGLAALLLKIKP